MAAHYEDGPVSADGSVSINIWHDDPRESPNFGERAEIFPCHFDAPRAEREAAVDRAIEHAKSVLPPQTVYEIRGKEVPRDRKTDYGRSHRTRDEFAADWAVAWYTLAAMQVNYKEWPLTERLPIELAKHNELGGYLVIGTFITPKRLLSASNGAGIDKAQT